MKSVSTDCELATQANIPIERVRCTSFGAEVRDFNTLCRCAIRTFLFPKVAISPFSIQSLG